MSLIDLCIDARMAFSAGIGTCIRQLAPLLNQPPFRVLLLVNQKEQLWCQNLEQIYFPSPIYSIQEQLYFPMKIPRCDLFWSPHYNIPLLPIRAKKKVVTIHDACHLALGDYLSLPERLYAKFVMKKALYSSNAIVTDSCFSKQELIRYLGLPKQNLSIIPPAVNRQLFQRVSNESILNEIREKYQLPSRFVLFVGSQKVHKNLHGLLKAFSNISTPNLHLVIVGKNKGLRNFVENIPAKQVLWLGEVPEKDLPPLYSLAEIFVFPSFYEGFGLPPLEAMSCGCPTIVSNSASLPEVCGDASIYIDPNRLEDLSAAIHLVASSPKIKDNLIQAGYNQVQTFSWQATANLYRQLFEETLLLPSRH